MHESFVIYSEEKWKILSLGVKRDDGMIYAHLAHTSEGKIQKNGFVPKQVCVFIDPAKIEYLAVANA